MMSTKTINTLLVAAFSTLSILAGSMQVHAVDSSESLSFPTDTNNTAIYQLDDSGLSSLLNQGAGIGPILKDVRSVEQGNQTLLVKTWEIPPEYNAELLAEEDFEKSGLYYKKAYLLQVSENYNNQQKLASETVVITHDNKADALAKLQPIIEYDRDGFSGQLTLQSDAIVTEAAGSSSYNYTITDTREYTGLERNDTYSIPKTVSKNGATLQLADVDWTPMGEGGYRALASYRGSVTGTMATGYISTATYIGEVTKNELESVTCAVVYEGSVIPLPPFDFSPYLIVGCGTVLLLGVAFFLLNKRDNTKIYAMIGKEYQLVHTQKLTTLAPIIDLSPEEISGRSDEFMIALNRLIVRKMRGHSIKIIGRDGVMKEQRVYKIRHFYVGRRLEEES